MPQKYKIAYMLGNAGKDDTARVYVRVLSGNEDIRIPTSVKVKKDQFNKGKIIKHPLAKDKTQELVAQRLEIEEKLSRAIQTGKKIDRLLFERVDGNFEEFVNKHVALNTGKFSDARIRHLKSTLNIILAFKSKISFSDIDFRFLQEFEKHLREEIIRDNKRREPETIRGIMTRTLSFINAAERHGLIDRKQYNHYKKPREIKKIPEYLTESQINDFKNLVDSIKIERKQNTGYYFLLSCYTGFRISDCKAFNYEERVKDNLIAIRAKKNKEIVSIPIYPKLAEIISYCKDNPFIETEEHARKSVKDICKDINMKNWKDIKFHSGRHSFAMWCLSKGLTKDEVAELLGDSREVVEVYARIINTQLHKSVLEKLG